MKKMILLVLLGLSSFSYAQEQLIVVVSSNLHATQGWMQRYEKKEIWTPIGTPFSITLGRNGLGYAEDKYPLKIEGDGRSPLGLFSLKKAFGYSKTSPTKLSYEQADDTLYCIDDSEDPHYNQLLRLPTNSIMPKSYEVMHRADGVYQYGLVVDYNQERVKERGSCIFIHLKHTDNHPTSGCTALDEADLIELLHWINPEKNPQMLQVSMDECRQYQKRFPGIRCQLP